jgi:hypothetical protein
MLKEWKLTVVCLNWSSVDLVVFNTFALLACSSHGLRHIFDYCWRGRSPRMLYPFFCNVLYFLQYSTLVMLYSFLWFLWLYSILEGTSFTPFFLIIYHCIPLLNAHHWPFWMSSLLPVFLGDVPFIISIFSHIHIFSIDRYFMMYEL